MRQYDEVISLGYNCEISFRIRDYYGKLSSWPFSWTYILNRDTFLLALDDLEDIFQGDVHICNDSRVNSMIECDKYHICFHPRSEYVESDGSILEDKLPIAAGELRARVSYLVKKFKKSLKDSSKDFLFFIGLTDNGKTSDQEFVIKLQEALNQLCPAKNYTLVVVVSAERYTDELEQLNSERIQVRKIKKFGKQKCNDISTDMFGWGKIFKEFLGTENMFGYYYRLQKHRVQRICNAGIKRVFHYISVK